MSAVAVPPRIQITKPKLLIVEGKDEEGFFSAAMSQHLSITDVQVLPIGGKQNLYGNLKALMAFLSCPTGRTMECWKPCA